MLKRILLIILLIIIILIAMGYCAGKRSVNKNSGEIKAISVTFNYKD